MGSVGDLSELPDSAPLASGVSDNVVSSIEVMKLKTTIHIPECKTVQGKDCIFPFNYKGETYNSCTKAESSNGAAWCATEVDTTGEVVNNKWQDCDSLCPGSDFTCNDGFLFNVEGKCINGTQAPGLLRSLQEGPLAATLDDIPSGRYFVSLDIIKHGF